MKKYIALLLVCIIMVFSLSACKSSDYNTATKLYESEDYEEAVALFEELGDYKDSSEMVQNCYYSMANVFLANGDYDEAYNLFNNLDGYEDSEDLKLECLYLKAGNLVSEEDYDSAIDLYESLGDYENSPELIQQCYYKKAESMMNTGDYDAAIEIYEQLGDYEESAEMKRECQYLKANDLMDLGNYEDALALYEEIGDYEDSSVLYVQCAAAIDPYEGVRAFIIANGLYRDSDDISGYYYDITPSSIDDSTVYWTVQDSDPDTLIWYFVTEGGIGRVNWDGGETLTYIFAFDNSLDITMGFTGNVDISEYNSDYELNTTFTNNINNAMDESPSLLVGVCVKTLDWLLDEADMGVTLADLGFTSYY